MSSASELLRPFSLPTTKKFSFTVSSHRVFFWAISGEMKAFQEPRSSCYQFNSHQCATSETVAKYVALLRKLAEHCNFGETRMKCCETGWCVGSQTLQFRTLTKALTITQALELAEKGSKDLQSLTVKDLPKDIHKFSHAPKSKKSSQTRKDVASDSTCYRCGGKHNQSTCRFKSEVVPLL